MFMLNELLIKELSNQVETNISDIQNIKDAEVYSTNEIETNKKWINGKPIYRKVIYLPNSNIVYNGATINANLSNAETTWIVNAWYQNPGATPTIPMNFNLSGSNYLRINVQNSATGELQINASENFSSSTLRNVYVILEYTKTTD